MTWLVRAAVAAHVVVVVALLVYMADPEVVGPLPALIAAAVVTVAWVLWARAVTAEKPAPPVMTGPRRFRAPEDADEGAIS